MHRPPSASDPSPGADGGSSPRTATILRLFILVLMLLTAIVAAVLAHRNPRGLVEYERHLTEDRPALDFRFDRLSQSWSEDELRAAFAPLAIECYENAPGTYLDDRSCFADIGSHNGVPAMGVSFFFAAGKLNRATILVPWWRHYAMTESVVREYGEPVASQWLPRNGVRLRAWRLSDGAALFANRDMPFDPLAPSAIHWNSARHCASTRCLGPS